MIRRIKLEYYYWKMRYYGKLIYLRSAMGFEGIRRDWAQKWSDAINNYRRIYHNK